MSSHHVIPNGSIYSPEDQNPTLVLQISPSLNPMDQVLIANVWLEFESIRGTKDYNQDWLSNVVFINRGDVMAHPPIEPHWTTTRPFHSSEELRKYALIPPEARQRHEHRPEVRGLFASYDTLIAFADFIESDPSMDFLAPGTSVGRVFREDDELFLIDLTRQSRPNDVDAL